MLTDLALYIEHLIITLGALGVFLGSVIEEIVVVIPSVLVQSGAGFFLLGGEPLTIVSMLKLITWVAIPAAIGVTIGSLLIYFLAYYGGTTAIRRYGKFFMLNAEKVEKSRTKIASRPSILTAITLLRFIPLLPNVAVTAAAGILRIPFWPYIYSTLIGVFIRVLYLGAIGWLSGNVSSIDNPERSFYGKIGILICVLAFISLTTTVIVRLVQKRKQGVQ